MAPNCPLLTLPTIEAMSALSAPALLGAVATTAGTAGAARRAVLVVFRTGFFAGRFRDDDVCFFLVVWEVELIGATASVASRITARAFTLR